MKRSTLIHTLISGLLLISASAHAEGGILSCEALKEKIATKLEGKGVNNYTLQVVTKDTETKYRVVGSCEGDKKKIIYKKEKAGAKAEE